MVTGTLSYHNHRHHPRSAGAVVYDGDSDSSNEGGTSDVSRHHRLILRQKGCKCVQYTAT